MTQMGARIFYVCPHIKMHGYLQVCRNSCTFTLTKR